QVARGVVDAVEIARNARIRRRDHNTARMRELLCFRIVCVAEAEGIREGLDRRLVPGEKVKTHFRTVAAVALYVSLFLLSRESGGLRRVEADGQNFVLPSCREDYGLQSADQAIKNLCAKHWAAIVDRRNNHRTAGEEFGQPNLLSGFIAEPEIEG